MFAKNLAYFYSKQSP